MREHVSPAGYDKAFDVSKPPPALVDGKQARALTHALDIRKFEIQLYWTRAAYFWTFIGASLAAYGAVRTIPDLSTKEFLSVFVTCTGFVFSFAWYCVNRGSKHWQENWENHVDLLEDAVIGPLYKTVLERPRPEVKEGAIRRHVTGPYPFSVSKVNQITSLYITVLWLLLLWHSLPPFSLHAHINREYAAVMAFALGTVVLIWQWGRTHESDHRLTAWQRRTGIAEPPTSEGP